MRPHIEELPNLADPLTVRSVDIELEFLDMLITRHSNHEDTRERCPGASLGWVRTGGLARCSELPRVPPVRRTLRDRPPRVAPHLGQTLSKRRPPCTFRSLFVATFFVLVGCIHLPFCNGGRTTQAQWVRHQHDFARYREGLCLPGRNGAGRGADTKKWYDSLGCMHA